MPGPIIARRFRHLTWNRILEKSLHENFYATLAQVLPLLLLAFIWDSGYRRKLGSEDPHGSRSQMRFWTKPRVRAYMLFVASVDLPRCG